MDAVEECCCVIVLSVFLVGCTHPPEFEENLLAVAEAELVDEHRQQIQAVLGDWFGTPDAPRAPKSPTTFELDQKLLEVAAGPAGYVQRGDDEDYLQRGLYRQHCASCHGITGSGMGPAAAVLAPYPRDFRPGVFKFKSTYLPNKPTDDDLRRVIEHGIPGTAMPSFSLLDDRQVDALVEYVKYLAMRGQVERELIAQVADEFDFDPENNTTEQPLDPGEDVHDRALVNGLVARISQPWTSREMHRVDADFDAVPSDHRLAAELSKSVERGRELFVSSRAKCTDCHGSPGGNVITKDFDDWNAAVADFLRKNDELAASIDRRQGQLAPLTDAQRDRAAKQIARDQRTLRVRQQVAWQLLEPQLARPRTLTEGVFRGGSEPIDLFRRIHQGVAGTPMPGHGAPRPGVEGTLTEAEIWQLVDYLRSLGPSDTL